MIDSLSEIATSDMLIYNKTININEITVPMSNKTPLREYNLWIMEYASIIVDEINKSIENETFKKLNQNL